MAGTGLRVARVAPDARKLLPDVSSGVARGHDVPDRPARVNLPDELVALLRDHAAGRNASGTRRRISAARVS
jgi:hypothetical protein